MTAPRRLRRFALPLLLAATAAGERCEEPAKPPTFAQRTVTTERIAGTYYDAYIRRDFAAMERISGSDTNFDDATADQLFGGEIVRGREAVFAHLRKTFASITHLAFQTTRRYASGEHAIFEGEVDWDFREPESSRTLSFRGMPLVVIVRVRDGQIVEHRDYGDYRVFVEQYRRQQTAPATANS